MEVSRGVLARLTAAFGRGETPAPSGNGLALKVGSIIVKGADGITTPAGHAWVQMGGTIPLRFRNTRSDRKTRNEYTMVTRRGGGEKRLYLRTWDQAAEQYKITRAGRAQGYHKQARFIVRVPVIFNRQQDGEVRRWNTDRSGRPLTLPIDSDAIYERFPKLRELGNVRAHESEEAMIHFIREAIVEYLRGFARDKEAFDNGDEKVTLADFNQSDIWYTFDAVRAQHLDEFTFALELPRYQEIEHPTTETVLGRPLRAFIEDSPDMWMKHRIIEEAWSTGDVNCVVQQLLVVLKKRKQAGNSRDGTQEEAQEPQFHPKALEVLIDQLAALMYPGKGARIAYEARSERELELLKPYKDVIDGQSWFDWGEFPSFEYLREQIRAHANRDLPGFTAALQEAYGGNRSQGTERLQKFFDRFFHRVEHQGQLHYVSRAYDVEPIGADPAIDEIWELPRPPPYETKDWREAGVTSNLVIELCSCLKRPCKVLFGSSCIVEFYPEGWDELDENAKKRQHKTLVLNIRGEHAFFYDLDFFPQLKEKQISEQPRTKLRPRPLDMDDPVAFKDMVWFTPEAFDKAFEEKTPRSSRPPTSRPPRSSSRSTASATSSGSGTRTRSASSTSPAASGRRGPITARPARASRSGASPPTGRSSARSWTTTTCPGRSALTRSKGARWRCPS